MQELAENNFVDKLRCPELKLALEDNGVTTCLLVGTTIVLFSVFDELELLPPLQPLTITAEPSKDKINVFFCPYIILLLLQNFIIKIIMPRLYALKLQKAARKIAQHDCKIANIIGKTLLKLDRTYALADTHNCAEMTSVIRLCLINSEITLLNNLCDS